MSDLIDRDFAIKALDSAIDDFDDYHENYGIERAQDIISCLPSVQPERLTDDDCETIRIHLNAYKEELCNQQRWKEAEEYQRIIDRFMAFASAQPEIIRCKDCKHRIVNEHAGEKGYVNLKAMCEYDSGDPFELGRCAEDDEWFCADAERRQDG